METPDTCRTFVPYFKIHAGKLDEARALCNTICENVVFPRGFEPRTASKTQGHRRS